MGNGGNRVAEVAPKKLKGFRRWVWKHYKSEKTPVNERVFVDMALIRFADFPDPKTATCLLDYLEKNGYGKELRAQAERCYMRWLSEDPKANLDGFSAKDKERIRKATRQVWGWSYPRKLCVARATDKKGFVYCENPDCESEGKAVPRIYVDHINPVGTVDSGFLERLFCPSTQLQALCSACHAPKTKAEAQARAQANLGVKADTAPALPKPARKKKPSFTDTY